MGGGMPGGMGGMMKQVQQMQEKMARVQDGLASRTVEAESGGGMVRAVVNGKQELMSIKINPEVVDASDPEMLEDLVLSAVNRALTAASDMAQAEMAKVTSGMLPPGMNLPGF